MNTEPPAIIFARQCGDVKRPVALIVDGPYKGWLCYKHPDGQWVTLREATIADYQLAAQDAWERLSRFASTGIIGDKTFYSEPSAGSRGAMHNPIKYYRCPKCLKEFVQPAGGYEGTCLTCSQVPDSGTSQPSSTSREIRA